MITLNFLVIVLCNEFVRGDKKGSVQNHKSKCRVRRKVQSWIWSLNLSFKKRERKKKVPICVISKSFLCRGKHTQILESVTTCQNLSKTWKHNICFICLESLGNSVLLFKKSSTNFLRSKCPIKNNDLWTRLIGAPFDLRTTLLGKKLEFNRPVLLLRHKPN